MKRSTGPLQKSDLATFTKIKTGISRLNLKITRIVSYLSKMSMLHEVQVDVTLVWKQDSDRSELSTDRAVTHTTWHKLPTSIMSSYANTN